MKYHVEDEVRVVAAVAAVVVAAVARLVCACGVRPSSSPAAPVSVVSVVVSAAGALASRDATSGFDDVVAAGASGPSDDAFQSSAGTGGNASGSVGVGVGIGVGQQLLFVHVRDGVAIWGQTDA